MDKKAETIIKKLSLTPHPEGGYYKEVYRSKRIVTIDGKTRNWITDIYFLLLDGQVSKIHKILSDEIWHFYEGAPLLLFDINNDFSGYDRIVLGKQTGKVEYKHYIQGGNWQCARSLGKYTLVGCSAAPGFDFLDFEMLDKGFGKNVVSRFPELLEYI